MAIKIGTLIIDLQATTAAFEKGMRNAERISLDSAAGIRGSLLTIATQLTKLKFDDGAWKKSIGIIGGLTAGIGVAVAAATVAVARQVAEQGKQMGKLAQMYGLPIETVSGLRVAAKLTGVSLEDLTRGMGRMAKAALQIAQSGLDTGGAFATLGIKVRDAHGNMVPMDQLLPQVAEKFSRLADGTAKTGLAMQLFGKTGAALIPFLNRGAAGMKEFQQLSAELGMTWSEKDKVAAEQLAHSMEILELRGEAFKEQYAKGVIPELNNIAEAFTKVDKSGKSAAQSLGENVGKVFGRLAIAVDTLQTGFRQLLLRLEDIGELTLAFRDIGNVGAFAANMGEYGANRQRRMEEYDKLRADMDQRVGAIMAGPEWVVPTGGAPGKSPEITFGSQHEDLAKSFKELDSLLERTRNLTNRAEGDPLESQISNLEALRLKLEEFRAARPGAIWSDVNAAMRQVVATISELREKQQAAFSGSINQAMLQRAEALGAIPSATPGATGAVLSAHQRSLFGQDTAAQNAARLQVFEETRTASERFAADLERLNVIYDHGKTAGDEYARAVANLRAQFNEAYDPTVRYDAEIKRLNDALASGNLTAQARINILKQLHQLEAEKAAIQPGAGLGTGVKAGLTGFGNQWQSWGAEGMQATVQAMHGIKNAMSNAFTEMIMGTKSVSAAFAEMGRNMLASIVSACAEMLAQWIATHIAMAIIAAIFGKQADPKAQAQERIASNVAIAASDAAVAAANTLALMSAMEPPPGPEIEAAATYGVGLGFAALASAAGGMMVDKDQIVKVHERERILPARYSRGLDRMVGYFNNYSGVNVSPPRSFSREALEGLVQTSKLAPAKSSSASTAPMPMMPLTIHVNGAGDPQAVADKVGDVVMARVKAHFRTNGVRG